MEDAVDSDDGQFDQIRWRSPDHLDPYIPDPVAQKRRSHCQPWILIEEGRLVQGAAGKVLRAIRTAVSLTLSWRCIVLVGSDMVFKVDKPSLGRLKRLLIVRRAADKCLLPVDQQIRGKWDRDHDQNDARIILPEPPDPLLNAGLRCDARCSS